MPMVNHQYRVLPLVPHLLDMEQVQLAMFCYNKMNYHDSHSVEKREIYSHLLVFREINSLVTSMVKTLLSRNFCQKSVTVIVRNFHKC